MCGPEVCFNGLVGSYEKHILSFGEDDDGIALIKLFKSAVKLMSFIDKIFSIAGNLKLGTGD